MVIHVKKKWIFSENNQLTINNTGISFTTGSQFMVGENNTMSIVKCLTTLDNSGLTISSSSKALIEDDSTVNLINIKSKVLYRFL